MGSGHSYRAAQHNQTMARKRICWISFVVGRQRRKVWSRDSRWEWWSQSEIRPSLYGGKERVRNKQCSTSYKKKNNNRKWCNCSHGPVNLFTCPELNWLGPIFNQLQLVISLSKRRLTLSSHSPNCAVMVSLQSFDSKHPVKTNEVCVQSFTHKRCVSAFELTSCRANGSATLIKSIKQQWHDTHLDLPFLLQNTPEHIWNSVYPDAKRAFCRTAREGASERKAEYLFTFSGLLTCIFLTVEPFGKAVSSTSKYTMFRATRRTEIACKQHGWKQT